LNFGEVAFLDRHVTAGGVAGWDAAGTVVAAASDGTGPPVGARVVNPDEVALLPEAVGFCLPRSIWRSTTWAAARSRTCWN
jgi:NADPH:quinone reductase-like Zn-dependent oxidoreductase